MVCNTEIFKRIDRFRNEYIKLCEEMSAILNNIEIDKSERDNMHQILDSEFSMVQNLWDEAKERMEEDHRLCVESMRENLSEEEIDEIRETRKAINRMCGFDVYKIDF